jgi:hypothetical protein
MTEDSRDECCRKLSSQMDAVMAQTRALEQRIEMRDHTNAADRRYADAALTADYYVRKDNLHRLQAQEAERIEAEREQAREDIERRRRLQARYDSVYRAFGSATPEPRDDEIPYRYRRRLLQGLARRLP